MSVTPHTIAFDIHNLYGVSGSITCPGGDIECRVAPCPEGCEEYSIRKDEQGWYHRAYDDDENDTQHRLATLPADDKSCNYKDWIDNGEGVVEEYDGPSTELRSAAITFNWGGDHFTWSYADQEQS